jgi:putative phosphoribosyl transferase
LIMSFKNRPDAGRKLAARLKHYAGHEDVLVVALPRGGVPVAYEVAAALDAPMDILLVRKLGVPGHDELAMGAIASGGLRVLNRDVLAHIPDAERVVEQVAKRELRELERREQAYRGVHPPEDLGGKTVILIDDGLATGSSMRAAVAAVKQHQPGRIVVAVPVGAASTCQELSAEVDEVICAVQPDPFLAVGLWYEDFSQTTDEEVRELLHRAHPRAMN